MAETSYVGLQRFCRISRQMLPSAYTANQTVSTSILQQSTNSSFYSSYSKKNWSNQVPDSKMDRACSTVVSHPTDALLSMNTWLGLVKAHPQRRPSVSMPTYYLFPEHSWQRPPGQPWYQWLDQLRHDSNRPIRDLLKYILVQGCYGPHQPGNHDN